MRAVDWRARLDAEPVPKVRRLVIAITAFGIHHGEMHLRRGMQPASTNDEWYI